MGARGFCYGVNGRTVGRAESLGFLPRKISLLLPIPNLFMDPAATATIHDRPKGQSTAAPPLREATQLLLLLRIQRGEGQRSEMKCMMGCKSVPIL